MSFEEKNELLGLPGPMKSDIVMQPMGMKK
jgi:hypothetical protein